MKKITISFSLVFISLLMLGIPFLLVVSPSQAAPIEARPNELILPEITKQLEFLVDLHRRNRMEKGGEEPSEDEEVNVENDALSMILPESVASDMKRMKERVQALTRFNQGRGGGASFGLAMMGVEGGLSGGGETSDEPIKDSAVQAVGPIQVGDGGLRTLPLSIGAMNQAIPVQNDGNVIPDGDMNGDGVFDLKDSVLIAQIAWGLREGTKEQLAKADLNQDGQVDKWDAFLGAMVLAGVITMDQAEGATPESMGIKGYGNGTGSGSGGGGIYTRFGSSMDPGRGTLSVSVLAIGDIDQKAFERITKNLAIHLRRLVKLMARLMGAKSVSSLADGQIDSMRTQLNVLYQNFERYLITGQMPLY